MVKRVKNPSRAAVSAASVKGNAGPNAENTDRDKVNSQNNQYKR
ncbi:YuzL family protein [Niallia oryzisoli]